MLLGTAIASLQDDTQVDEILAAMDDWVLMARVRAAADVAGLSLAEFASAAIGAFLTNAGDEEWLSLVTAANRSAEPAAACLKVMVAWGLAQATGAPAPALSLSRQS